MDMYLHTNTNHAELTTMGITCSTMAVTKAIASRLRSEADAVPWPRPTFDVAALSKHPAQRQQQRGVPKLLVLA